MSPANASFGIGLYTIAMTVSNAALAARLIGDRAVVAIACKLRAPTLFRYTLLFHKFAAVAMRKNNNNTDSWRGPRAHVLFVRRRAKA